MLSLEQISTLINGLKSWVLNEIKKSKADLGPLADEFVSFKEQVQDTIDNAALKQMVVMAKDGTLEANYNSSEIYNHVTSGGTVVFKFESIILPLTAFDETFSAFLFTANSGDSIGTMGFIVYEDGRIKVEEEVSNTIYIVNLDEYGTSASRGAAEIIDIANSGRLVLLEYSGDYYNLVEKSNADTEQAIATFQKCFYYETEIRVVSIDIDYNAGANIDTYDSVHIGVSSVNGQSGEVELTAEDVGALTEEDLSEMGFLTSEDAVTDSPVPFDADTLNGYDSEYFAAKEYVDGKYQKTILAPTTAEVGQTIRVSEIDENGKPTVWEAVDFPEIAPFPTTPQFDITIEADENGETPIEIQLSNLNGEPLKEYGFTALYIDIYVPKHEAVEGSYDPRGYINGKGVQNYLFAPPAKLFTESREVYWRGFIDTRLGFCLQHAATSYYEVSGASLKWPTVYKEMQGQIIQQFQFTTGSGQIPAGTVFKLYLR